MAVRAGLLRHRVNILRSDVSQNSYGEETVSWSTDKTVWASIEPMRGREYYEAKAIQSLATHRIRMRYTTLSNTTRIGPKHRIEKVADERVFSILEPPRDVDERKIYLEFLCGEAT